MFIKLKFYELFESFERRMFWIYRSIGVFMRRSHQRNHSHVAVLHNERPLA